MSSARAYFDRLLMLSCCGGRSALPAGVNSPCREYHEEAVARMESSVWSGVVVSLTECCRVLRATQMMLVYEDIALMILATNLKRLTFGLKVSDS